MPANESASRRGNGRLLTVLFWFGAGVAVLAAGMLAFSQRAGALRVAALVAVLAIGLAELSLTLRRGSQDERSDEQDELYGEVDALRHDLAAADRARRAVADRVEVLQRTVDQLRAELAGRQPDPATPGPSWAPPVAAPPVGRAAAPAAMGVVRRTETVVTTRHTVVDRPGVDEPARVYGGPPVDHQATGFDDHRRSGRAGEPDDPRGWTAVGDRWASLRRDGSGGELRVGERRAAVRHGPDGTELRLEDRWAAARQDRHDAGGADFRGGPVGPDTGRHGRDGRPDRLEGGAGFDGRDNGFGRHDSGFDQLGIDGRTDRIDGGGRGRRFGGADRPDRQALPPAGPAEFQLDVPAGVRPERARHHPGDDGPPRWRDGGFGGDGDDEPRWRDGGSVRDRGDGQPRWRHGGFGGDRGDEPQRWRDTGSDGDRDGDGSRSSWPAGRSAEPHGAARGPVPRQREVVVDFDNNDERWR